MNESRLIEGYIFNTLPPDERLLFEARLITDQTLAGKLHAQKLTYRAIEDYGRKQLHEEIKKVEDKLFKSPKHSGFRRSIFKIFNS